MSANPLEHDADRERRIRDRAYHLWINDGRPHGRAHEFWERARELVGMEDSAGSAQLPNPQTTGEDPARSEPVEEAFLQDNLGEFPDHLTDQGAADSTPKPKRASAGAVKPEKAPAHSRATSPETLPAKPSLKKKAIEAAPAKAPRGGKPKK